MMPNLGNFIRGGGRQVLSAGRGQGGFVTAIPRDTPLPRDIETWVLKLADLDRVAAVRAFETDAAQTSIKTNEKSLRANDSSYKSLVLIETLDEASLVAALANLEKAAPHVLGDANTKPLLYANFFCLDRRIIPGLLP
jgi:hypothetical protein